MAALRRGTKHSVELGDEVVVLSRKAAKQAVKAEKQIGRAAKADRKAAEKAGKVAGKQAERDAKNAKNDTDAGEGGPDDPLTGAKVKRYIGVARVVVPVLIPIVYQAVGTARARWDEYRARRLGVAPDELADFTGRGAALYARIHNISLSVRDLRSRRAGSDDAADVRAFADDTESRLSDLEAAVRAAEQMPTTRRRRAHDAAGAELDRIEAAVLSRLGLDRGGVPPRAIGG